MSIPVFLVNNILSLLFRRVRRGRALDASSAFDPEAEKCLARAVSDFSLITASRCGCIARSTVGQ